MILKLEKKKSYNTNNIWKPKYEWSDKNDIHYSTKYSLGWIGIYPYCIDLPQEMKQNEQWKPGNIFLLSSINKNKKLARLLMRYIHFNSTAWLEG